MADTDPDGAPPPPGVHTGNIENITTSKINLAGGDLTAIEQASFEGARLEQPRIGSAIFQRGPSAAEQRLLRLRQDLLAEVYRRWVQGVLEKSLFHVVRLQLGLQALPQAAEALPYGLRVGDPTASDAGATVLPGSQIDELFAQSGKALLILGAPGAGKTTLLLELARLAIQQAQADPLAPMPVVFNLGSWGVDDEDLSAWMRRELNRSYKVTPETVQRWLDERQLLPLLDGLDEVRPGRRLACIRAINAYRRLTDLAPLVVCSREGEYLSAGEALDLAPVRVQPLTPAQVQDYLLKLETGGAQLAELRIALAADAALQELLQTPLMLSVAVSAFQAGAALDLPAADPQDDPAAQPEANRRRLYARYIGAMLARKPLAEPQRLLLLRGLGWAARKLERDNRKEFLIEDLQPSDFSGRARRGLDWLGSLAGIILGIFMAWLFGRIAVDVVSDWSDAAWWRWATALVRTLGVLFGFLIGLGVGTRWIIGPVHPTERWRFHFNRYSLAATGIVMSLFIGIVAGVAFAQGQLHLIMQPNIWLFALYLLIVLLISTGFERLPLETRSRPNEGIRRSALNALLLGGLACLGLWLVVWILYLLGVLSSVELLSIALVILIAGLFIAFSAGGNAVLKHAMLRLFLVRSGYLPWGIAPLMDSAVERVFLYRVGGGWVFIHRTLQDYFSALQEA